MSTRPSLDISHCLCEISRLEHIPFLRNRDVLSIHTWARVLIGEPGSTSPGHALNAAAVANRSIGLLWVTTRRTQVEPLHLAWDNRRQPGTEAVASGAALSRTGHALLDDAATRIGIDRPVLRTPHRL